MNIETYSFVWEELAFCKDIADYFILILDKNRILDECKKINIDRIDAIYCEAVVSAINDSA